MSNSDIIVNIPTDGDVKLRRELLTTKIKHQQGVIEIHFDEIQFSEASKGKDVVEKIISKERKTTTIDYGKWKSGAAGKGTSAILEKALKDIK